ncbi:MAG: hypothetical protein ACOY94_16950 [Bacillota bacterium]
MRFLRVSLAALMVLAMVAGSALAAESATDTTIETTESSSTTDSSTTDSSTTDSSTTDGSTTDSSTTDPATEPVVYEVKLSGTVLSVTPPDGDTPGSITLLVAGKEVTVTYTADMVEGELAEGSYVELKGTTEGLEKIEVSDEDEAESELKTSVVGVTVGEDGSASITLMIGGQEMTFTAEELGIPAEAMELVTAGAEFKFETNEDGETEMKISSEAGEVKVEVKEDGTVEVKVETEDDEKDEAEAAKEAAKAAREAAKEAAKAAREAAKAAREAEKESQRDADDDDEVEVEEEEDEEDDD